MSSLTSGMRQLQNNSISKKFGSSLFRLWLICPGKGFELAILEASDSDQMISHAMLFEPFAVCMDLYGMLIS
jgi:hypothetical protein